MHIYKQIYVIYLYIFISAIKINAVGMSDIAEGFAFSYVGLSMWEYVDSGFHVSFSCSILFIVVCSRMITIMSLCLICSGVNKRYTYMYIYMCMCTCFS
jgi:hypothetical protein